MMKRIVCLVVRGFCADQPNILAFLELHVEQGPVLDLQRIDIGVVQGIVGQRRVRFSVHGQENHAGTTPMSMRDDALVKTAPIITYIHDKALDAGGLVATVSQLMCHLISSVWSQVRLISPFR